ncbi:reverse transcriptase [Gossypium australe]|uniref:Reverse transcriptase n=1 Tax=Gossypium australe TaxID=47621 RepID=A0A5B6VG91_9ROSI|nr:reverse transcriptase [Gossypium australe]
MSFEAEVKFIWESTSEMSDNNLAELIDTKLQLNFEIDKDETYWEQRARVNWLKLEDRNTAVFHNHATQRRQKNCIRKLQNTNGEETENLHEMVEIARNYFRELFEEKKMGNYENILTGTEQCITEEDNRCLTEQYTKEEIWEALQSIGATKAPGEDGFPALFYKKYWHIVGEEASSFCLQHLNGGMETIANHFRGVLEKCIDDAQSAFVPRRLILDNVLLAYETLHTLKRKKLGKKGWMAVKLDMSKAYDRVEWSCIHEIIRKMGFDPNWINSIMKCISTVSYSVILNGQVGDIFHPSIGLRQGDPLIPFLFLICGEGLSSLMRKATEEGHLKGVKVSRRGPQISHLLFADDCILFGEANERGAVFFSSNTREEEKNLVTRILGVRSSNDPERYLGLPNMVGRRKKEAFQNLKDRFKQRIDNWSIRHLSQGGKEVFIKKGHGKRGIYWCAWKELCIAKEHGGLGFQSLDQFNVSLLAKQGRRLINYPNSLLAQVLKAKYFPNLDFIHARLGNLPSLTWKSVRAVKGLLQDGLGWRIGKGDQVSVWNDRWIPGIDSIRSNDNINSAEIELVSSLIDSTTRKWKAELIEHTFRENIAKKILQLPLAEEAHEDFQICPGENSGEFTTYGTGSPGFLPWETAINVDSFVVLFGCYGAPEIN